jgi:hypothetical protein
MKTHPAPLTRRRSLSLVCLVALFSLFTVVRAADDKLKAAIEKADDERIAATKAADRAKLEASYSDALHYAHSSGRVDTKASQIQGIVTSTSVYEAFEYKERTIIPAGPGVALMKGRVLVHMRNKASGEKTVNDINYLSVWREENGKWRFLAWQASKNPPADAAKK